MKTGSIKKIIFVALVISLLSGCGKGCSLSACAGKRNVTPVISPSAVPTDTPLVTAAPADEVTVTPEITPTSEPVTTLPLITEPPEPTGDTDVTPTAVPEPTCTPLVTSAPSVTDGPDVTEEPYVTIGPSATVTPQATGTPAATEKPAATPTPETSKTPTPVPSVSAGPTPTVMVAVTPIVIPSDVVPTFTPAPTDTPVPTATHTPVPTATDTPVPTATGTPQPTSTNMPAPSATSSPVPTETDTPFPTATYTPVPTATPTNTPDPLYGSTDEENIEKGQYLILDYASAPWVHTFIDDYFSVWACGSYLTDGTVYYYNADGSRAGSLPGDTWVYVRGESSYKSYKGAVCRLDGDGNPVPFSPECGLYVYSVVIDENIYYMDPTKLLGQGNLPAADENGQTGVAAYSVAGKKCKYSTVYYYDADGNQKSTHVPYVKDPDTGELYLIQFNEDESAIADAYITRKYVVGGFYRRDDDDPAEFTETYLGHEYKFNADTFILWDLDKDGIYEYEVTVAQWEKWCELN